MQKEYPQIKRIIEIVAKLRHPQDGCPWDLKQDHKSLLKYLVEESYEYINAVENVDYKNMEEELGDVFLQVLLHSQIASESGHFDLESVSQKLAEKMIRRHPHVFEKKEEGLTSEEVLVNWEKIKKQEKTSNTPFFTNDDLALPALMSAQKIGKKSGKVNFDWENVEQVFLKVEEELEEVRIELKDQEKNREKIFEEIGDLLFSTVQLARHMGFEAEDCLRQANKKFIRRFEVLENLINSDNKDIQALNIPELEEYWQQAKKTL